jgi:hypothetical protein
MRWCRRLAKLSRISTPFRSCRGSALAETAVTLPALVAATGLLLSVAVAGGTDLRAATAAQVGAEALANGATPAQAQVLAGSAGGDAGTVQVTTNTGVGTVTVTLPARTWWGVIRMTVSRSVVLPDMPNSGSSASGSNGMTGQTTTSTTAGTSYSTSPVYAPPPTSRPAPWPIFGGPGLGRTVLP